MHQANKEKFFSFVKQFNQDIHGHPFHPFADRPPTTERSYLLPQHARSFRLAVNKDPSARRYFDLLDPFPVGSLVRVDYSDTDNDRAGTRAKSRSAVHCMSMVVASMAAGYSAVCTLTQYTSADSICTTLIQNTRLLKLPHTCSTLFGPLLLKFRFRPETPLHLLLLDIDNITPSSTSPHVLPDAALLLCDPRRTAYLCKGTQDGAFLSRLLEQFPLLPLTVTVDSDSGVHAHTATPQSLVYRVELLVALPSYNVAPFLNALLALPESMDIIRRTRPDFCRMVESQAELLSSAATRFPSPDSVVRNASPREELNHLRESTDGRALAGVHADFCLPWFARLFETFIKPREAHGLAGDRVPPEELDARGAVRMLVNHKKAVPPELWRMVVEFLFGRDVDVVQSGSGSAWACYAQRHGLGDMYVVANPYSDTERLSMHRYWSGDTVARVDWRSTRKSFWRDYEDIRMSQRASVFLRMNRAIDSETSQPHDGIVFLLLAALEEDRRRFKRNRPVYEVLEHAFGTEEGKRDEQQQWQDGVSCSMGTLVFAPASTFLARQHSKCLPNSNLLANRIQQARSKGRVYCLRTPGDFAQVVDPLHFGPDDILILDMAYGMHAFTPRQLQLADFVLSSDGLPRRTDVHKSPLAMVSFLRGVYLECERLTDHTAEYLQPMFGSYNATKSCSGYMNPVRGSIWFVGSVIHRKTPRPGTRFVHPSQVPVYRLLCQMGSICHAEPMYYSASRIELEAVLDSHALTGALRTVQDNCVDIRHWDRERMGETCAVHDCVRQEDRSCLKCVREEERRTAREKRRVTVVVVEEGEAAEDGVVKPSACSVATRSRKRKRKSV